MLSAPQAYVPLLVPSPPLHLSYFLHLHRLLAFLLCMPMRLRILAFLVARSWSSAEAGRVPERR